MADTSAYESHPRAWKRWLGFGAVGAVVTAMALAPSLASGTAQTSMTDQSTQAGHALHAALSQEELARVRSATARFHRVQEAVDAGYELGWVNGAGVRIVAGCVSSPGAGAMGYHYFNAELMADNGVDARRPEVLVYAPRPDGGLRLVAVEWVVRGPQSNPTGVSQPPSVLGMPMHILVPPPGPAFYLTHAWVWAHNPAGMFADFNPEVSCG